MRILVINGQSMKIFDRYILKTHAGPLFFGFFTIMFVFILSFLTRFIDHLVGRGLDFWVLVEMLLLQSAWMVSLALPMSVLISTVMAFGTLTNSSEMTVMRAGGISVYRLVFPVLLASLVLSLCDERFNNVLLPEANHRANALLSDISRLKPGFAVSQGSFSDVIKGYSLIADKVDNKSGMMEGVVMYDRDRPNLRTVITAESGRITFTPDYRYLVMTLRNGQINELALPAMNKYRRISFSKHRYIFEASGYGFERTDEKQGRRGGRELSASELKAQALELLAKEEACQVSVDKELGGLRSRFSRIRNVPGEVSRPASTPGQAPAIVRALEVTDGKIASLSSTIEQRDFFREQYLMTMIEYHKKYSLALACVVFALVGAPLGVMARRGGFGVGAGLSLLFFVMYWAMMIGGEKIAKKGVLTPAVWVWMPDLVLAAIGIYMLNRLSRSITGSTR
jgi:lipopolysaccharide export system permease protein